MKIDRSVPWCLYEYKPIVVPALEVLRDEILLRDIVGVEVPDGCETVQEAYDVLKAQGEIFLDGQILVDLVFRKQIKRTPLWDHPKFGILSYSIFAGVLVNYRGLRGWHDGFPTLGFTDNGATALLHMFNPDCAEFSEKRMDGSKDFFAVLRKH